jgi:hypothetical protein
LAIVFQFQIIFDVAKPIRFGPVIHPQWYQTVPLKSYLCLKFVQTMKNLVFQTEQDCLNYDLKLCQFLLEEKLNVAHWMSSLPYFVSFD